MLELLGMILFLAFAVAITKYTIVFLAFMALLFKFTAMDKWWLWFVVIMVLLFKAGFNPNIVVLGLIMLVFMFIRKIFICDRVG
jgi:hypothetical protein